MELSDFNNMMISAPMVKTFKLKPSECMILAIIQGFSQEKNCKYEGTISYLCEWINADKKTVYTILQTLIDKNLIEKEVYYVNNVKFCKYKSKYIEQLNETGGVKITPVGGGVYVDGNNLHYRIINNNIIDIDINSESNIDYTNTNNNKEKNTKKEKSPQPTDEQTQMFEQARKYYPGNKGGLKAELDNFVKKYPDEWQKALQLLLPAMMREKVDKEQKLKNNNFKQNWKHFTTWINKRSWEEEYPNVTQAEINLLGVNVTTSESGEQKVEVKQDRSSFPMYQSLHGNPECYPEGTESRCGNWIIKDKKCVRTHRY